MTRRIHPLWLAALGGTAVWTALAAGDGRGDDEADLVLPRAQRPAASPGPAPGARAAATVASPQRARATVAGDSGRGVMDPAWVPPPPPSPRSSRVAATPEAAPAPAPVAAAPAAPSGPPLRLVGVVHVDSPQPQVYFALGERLILARAGDVIDARFRIEEISPRRVVVVTLPDETRTEIPITTALPAGG